MFRFPLGTDAELRLLELRHAREVFTLVNENRAHLRRWLTWVDATHTEQESRNFIHGALQQFADNRGFTAGIWYKNALAGVVGFNDIDWLDRKAEFGYWLGAKYQGHGLVTQACRALTTYSFIELGLNRVEILCATDNFKSRAIPERLGFTQEGILRQAQWLHHRFVDLVIYAMLAEDWPQTHL